MIDISKINKKINISYARYLKFKRADRYTNGDELSFAEKHSLRVVTIKKFILRVVILLVILLIVWPFANKNWSDDKKLNFHNENFQQNNSEEQSKNNNNQKNLPVMLQPKFFGNDDNGQPFNINAINGVSVNENKVVLNELDAEMYLHDKSKVNITSKSGDYNVKNKILVLNGGVVFKTENEYVFTTNSAYAKLNESIVSGSEKVNIKGRLGDIDANGFTIKNTGEEIVLFGGVDLKAKINDEDIVNFNKTSQQNENVKTK